MEWETANTKCVKEHFNLVGNWDSVPTRTPGRPYRASYRNALMKRKGCLGIYPPVSLVEVCPQGHQISGISNLASASAKHAPVARESPLVESPRSFQ